MGRYYSGDINGKFWFALQSSSAADRFGVTGEQPSVLHYYFDEMNLDDVLAEIANIKESLGEKLNVIEKFFEKNLGYNDEMLTKAGITNKELEDYADLELGRKIRDCIKREGSCSFEAEF